MPSKKSTLYRKCSLISDDVDDARNQARPPGAHKHRCRAEIRKRRRSDDDPAVSRVRQCSARLPAAPLPTLGRLRHPAHGLARRSASQHAHVGDTAGARSARAPARRKVIQPAAGEAVARRPHHAALDLECAAVLAGDPCGYLAMPAPGLAARRIPILRRLLAGQPLRGSTSAQLRHVDAEVTHQLLNGLERSTLGQKFWVSFCCRHSFDIGFSGSDNTLPLFGDRRQSRVDAKDRRRSSRRHHSKCLRGGISAVRSLLIIHPFTSGGKR